MRHSGASIRSRSRFDQPERPWASAVGEGSDDARCEPDQEVEGVEGNDNVGQDKVHPRPFRDAYAGEVLRVGHGRHFSLQDGWCIMRLQRAGGGSVGA
jgi:hypothetical protein